MSVARLPPMRRLHVLLSWWQSPQSRRWRPQIQRSPGLVSGTAGGSTTCVGIGETGGGRDKKGGELLRGKPGKQGVKVHAHQLF